MKQWVKYLAFGFLGILVGAGAVTAELLYDVVPSYQHSLDALQARNDDLSRKLAAANDATDEWKQTAQNGTKYLAQETLTIQQLRAGQQRGVALLKDAQSATIIYQHAPGELDVNLSVEFRGLRLANLPKLKIGNTPMVPRFIIPGKVTPVTIGQFNGEQFYFFENGQFAGPMNIFPLSQ